MGKPALVRMPGIEPVLCGVPALRSDATGKPAIRINAGLSRLSDEENCLLIDHHNRN